MLEEEEESRNMMTVYNRIMFDVGVCDEGNTVHICFDFTSVSEYPDQKSPTKPSLFSRIPITTYPPKECPSQLLLANGK